jgi:hypothetical protein
VNEDIFDRMPSRRFKRADRRAEHHDDPEPRRFERRVSGPSSEPRRTDAWGGDEPGRDGEWDEIRARRDDWADEHERRQVAPRRDDWPADEPRRTSGRDAAAPRRAAGDDYSTRRAAAGERTAPRNDAGDDSFGPRRAAGDEYAEAASRFAAEYAPPRSAADDDAYAAPRSATDGRHLSHRPAAGDEYAEAASRFAADYDDAPAAAPAPRASVSEHRRHTRRPAESWTDDIPAVQPDEGKRPVDSWLEPDPGKELALAPGESLTIVLESPEAAPPMIDEATGRRTVTITGHPDRMPIPRTKRPPRSAIERIGASPDRIVGYAVLLGFVLVLIAVLTTGQ